MGCGVTAFVAMRAKAGAGEGIASAWKSVQWTDFNEQSPGRDAGMKAPSAFAKASADTSFPKLAMLAKES
jgi:hypothetical protein